MRQLDVKDKLKELGANHPSWDVFRRLGDLTKLRAEGGTFRAVNYESGPLLYALVRRHRPRAILEVGTGRGFGALSMAMALEDAGIDGARVVTIDALGEDAPQDWALDDGSGPRVARLSRREVWEAHFDVRLRERIVQVRGTSFEALPSLLDAADFAADFAYIDGDHTYRVVRHDFYASLLLLRRPFLVLLDDYTPLSHLYGVRRLVDEEIAPAFEAEAIHTDGRWDGPATAVPLSHSDQAQVLIDSERMLVPLEEAFPPNRLERFVRVARRRAPAAAALDGLRGRVARFARRAGWR